MSRGTASLSRGLLAIVLILLAAVGTRAQKAPDQKSENTTASRSLRSALDLAEAGDLTTAKSVLETGAAAYPRDPRFAVELAGIAFLEKRREDAKKLLRRARRLGSHDPYVPEFLGVLYLLDGNVEAALASFNPIGKPILAMDANATGYEGILKPELASDATRFPAGRMLTLNDALRARRVAALLDVCGSDRLSLESVADDRFHAVFRCAERPSFGSGRIASLFMLARGAAYETTHLHLPNLNKDGWSWNSMLRWDARKKRIWSQTAMPYAGRAGWRLAFDGDAREEQWQMLSSGTRTVEEAFVYRRQEAGISIAAIVSPRSTWENRLSLARRTFARSQMYGMSYGARTLDLTDSSSVRYGHGLNVEIFRNPFRRVRANVDARASFERYFAQRSSVYRGETSIALDWQPRAQGDDGRVTARIATGAQHGATPLPEAFTMGLERDGGIPLRGHIGTSGGRKGSALYGDRYFAAGAEIRKNLLRFGIVSFSLIPFVDAGWIRGAERRYDARRMQFDTGVELVAATPGGTEIRLSYAWDLRNQRRSFYTRSDPYP